MQPGAPRDIDLNAWLNSAGYHSPDTELKRLGHETARRLVADIAVQLHYLLPAGVDKSIVFQELTRVLMYANRALAVNGGPDPEKISPGSLRGMIADKLGDAKLPADPRVQAATPAATNETRPTYSIRTSSGARVVVQSGNDFVTIGTEDAGQGRAVAVYDAETAKDIANAILAASSEAWGS